MAYNNRSTSFAVNVPCCLVLLVAAATNGLRCYILPRASRHARSCGAMIKIINSRDTSRDILARISIASCTASHGVLTAKAAKDSALNYKCQVERAKVVPAYAARVKSFSSFAGVRRRDFIRVTFVRRLWATFQFDLTVRFIPVDCRHILDSRRTSWIDFSTLPNILEHH